MKKTKKKWFRITGRDMRIHQPDGFVLSFWLGAETEELARERCAELDIRDIEMIKEDPGGPNESR